MEASVTAKKWRLLGISGKLGTLRHLYLAPVELNSSLEKQCVSEAMGRKEEENSL